MVDAMLEIDTELYGKDVINGRNVLKHMLFSSASRCLARRRQRYFTTEKCQKNQESMD